MDRYYTRACNFYYGASSKKLINLKKTLPLNNRKDISFDHIEIITRKSIKKLSIHITSSPFAINLSIRWEPRNPAPPVTKFLYNL